MFYVITYIVEKNLPEYLHLLQYIDHRIFFISSKLNVRFMMHTANKKQINVAVVDDGINEKRFNTGELIHNIEINRDCEIHPRSGYDPYEASHGTTCAAIIKKIVPDAALSSVKILSDATRKGIRGQLIKAIDWCVENGIDIINLSAGTIDYRDFDGITDCVSKAAEKGLIIVAACNNRNIYTCPASLEYVIGVKCNRKESLGENEFIYNTCTPDGIEMTACSTYKLLDFSGKEKTTSRCNSFSAPTITAAVYKIMADSDVKDICGIRQELMKKSVAVSENNTGVDDNDRDKVEIGVPLVVLFDMGTGKATGIAENLVRLFRNDGYNAVLTCDERPADAGRYGMVALSTICRDKHVNGTNLKTLYRIYDPDIIIACVEMSELASFEPMCSHLGIVPDIAILASVDKADKTCLPEWQCECENIIICPVSCGSDKTVDGLGMFDISHIENIDYLNKVYSYIHKLLE